MVTTPTDNCTKAWGSRSYNLYTGNSSYLARKNSAFYNSTPASEVKFGWWVAVGCIDAVASMQDGAAK